MAEIDVGSPAITRNYTTETSLYTSINLTNPANASGVLDNVEIFFHSSKGTYSTKVGSFYVVSSVIYHCRDYADLGLISAGAELKTFTGLSIEITEADFIGIFNGYKDNEAFIKSAQTGYDGVMINQGDGFASDKLYSLLGGDTLSLYATGETVAAGSNFIYGVFKSPIFHSTIFRS